MRTRVPTLALVALAACGGGGGSGDDGGDDAPHADANPTGNDDLDTATGCAGVYNPDQILDLRFEMAPGDLTTILADTTFTIVVSATMRCNDDPPITVGIRRKRSGGTRKVGFKVDFDELVADQEFHDLRKLGLENGESSGSPSDPSEAGALVGEYLAWRAMVLSGAVTGRAVFVNVFINGEAFGVYVNVEQPDKRFLRVRFGDDDGWLYKHSGGDGDGFKTHETDGMDDPYDDYFCFFDGGCGVPSADALAADLPSRLDIPQMLRMGAVNAIIANTDSPIFKDNNYYWYDWPGGREYLAWDLDTTWRDNGFHVFDGGGGGGSTKYTDVLFVHWRDDYAAIARELLDTRLTVAAISGELDRAVSVAGPSFAADPYFGGGADGAASALRDYYTARHAEVVVQLGP